MISLPDEELLISKAREGDNLSFEKLAFHYLGLISKISSEYKAEGYETGDFVQEGLLGLLNAVKTYDSGYGKSFRNYAIVCIRHRFISVVKQSHRKKSLPEGSTIPLEELEITDESLNPESQILSNERLETLFGKAKELLSAREYSVLNLYISGYSYKEISRLLSISEKSVDNALARGKKKLLKFA
jgi:RNA polymerase sporulation-specific sigma factor